MREAMAAGISPVTVTPWWRHRWPWLLMLGPFLAVLAGSYTAYLAFTRQDALVTGDYYKRGKAINQDLRRDHAASVLGLKMAVRYDASGGVLSGRILGKDGVPEGRLFLHLAHATQPGKDVWLVLQPDASGVFHAPLPMLERSHWTVEAESEQRAWRLASTWHWPDQSEVWVDADAL